MVKLVDLTVKIKHRSKSEPIPAKIEFIDHKEGANKLGMLSSVKGAEFPDGLGLAMESITISTHCGTHLDAPWHFGPEINGIKNKTIDQIPLEWCFSDGIVLNFADKKDGEKITEQDIKTALDKLPVKLKPFDIVLIRTDRDKSFDKTSRYSSLHPGMTREATIYLIEKGIKIIGTDGYGFDRPFELMFKDYKTTGNNVIYEEYHQKISKPEIDEIDKVLAEHYGFTQEELDFIINYDIKYRMGKELEEE